MYSTVVHRYWLRFSQFIRPFSLFFCHHYLSFITLRKNHFIDNVHDAVTSFDVSFDDFRTPICGVARTLLEDMVARAHGSCVSVIGHFSFFGTHQVLGGDCRARYQVSLQYKSNVAGDGGGVIEGGVCGSKDSPFSIVQVVNETILGQEGTNDGEVTA